MGCGRVGTMVGSACAQPILSLGVAVLLLSLIVRVSVIVQRVAL